MYDWSDDFIAQLCLSYPRWTEMIQQANDLGDLDKIINLVFALETNRREI